MKAIAKLVVVTFFIAGLLIMTAPETRPQDVSTRAISPTCRLEGTPLDPEWGKNMPAYGWIHDYVIREKKEAMEKGSEAMCRSLCPALDPDWGKNMPEYGWIHYYVISKKVKPCS
jgi:hypothetical protein